MSLTSTELRLVVDELAPLAGAVVQKIRAPSPLAVVLELRTPGASHLLLISAEAESRILRIEARPPSPRRPLPIQNLLRAHLAPARLRAMELEPGERVLRLHFETPTGQRTLVAELIGRKGNLHLLDEAGRILGSARRRDQGGRDLRVGATYLPPAPRPHEEAPPRFAPAPGAGPVALSAAVEAWFGPREEERLLAERKRELARSLERRRRRAERALQRVREDEARAGGAEHWRRLGDLLKPVVSRIPRGSASVLAIDYREEGPVEVEVPLDPKLSGPENLERYYKRYRRLQGAGERIRARRSELESSLAGLREQARRLEAAQSWEELEGLDDGRDGEAAAAPPAGGPSVRLPYRLFHSSSGKVILVGKGARENDRLTLRHAKGSDLWLHARGRPGAHVIVPLARGAQVDEGTLLDACALAAHFSSARGEAVAEIALTHARHVRKPKGAAPGSVIITQDRSVAYRHEAERIARLLQQAPFSEASFVRENERRSP